MKAAYITLALFASISAADADDVPKITVLAADYPPHTTNAYSNGGRAFELLHRFMEQRQIKAIIKPRILPSVRVGRAINEGDWCFSFYPPDSAFTEDGKPGFVQITSEQVYIGLVRQKENTAFTWDNLKAFSGKRIAWLRVSRGSGPVVKLEEAGAEIVFADTQASILKLLLAGRVDFGVGDSMVFDTGMEGYVYRSQLQLSETALHHFDYGIYVNKACPEASLFDGHMKELRAADNH